MAEDEAATVPISRPNSELLKWPKKDERCILYVAYHVGHLDRTINFYTEAIGMKLLSRKDVPEEKHSYAFLGFGPEANQFVIKLKFDYGVNNSCDIIRTGFGHLGLETPDVHKMVENIRGKGGDIVKEPTLFEMDGSDYSGAIVKDPDGCTFELIQSDSISGSSPSPAPPLNHVMLFVADLDRSIQFYEKALGMKLLKKIIGNSEHEATVATIGYEDEKSTIIELNHMCAGPQYTNENSNAQVAIGTNDVCKSALAVNLVTQELGGKITRPPGPLPVTKTNVATFIDPDGWEIVLIDNGDFLKEMRSTTVIE
ncbi:Glyoxalase I [Trema orientale]|uniref:Glyoxalase I n=1 Tax=Trema orientale TaxID=63057 RepID=A0A2P5EAM3_TREOI|nr:Glyoxalase I [Trema orientale]